MDRRWCDETMTVVDLFHRGAMTNINQFVGVWGGSPVLTRSVNER